MMTWLLKQLLDFPGKRVIINKKPLQWYRKEQSLSWASEKMRKQPVQNNNKNKLYQKLPTILFFDSFFLPLPSLFHTSSISGKSRNFKPSSHYSAMQLPFWHQWQEESPWKERGRGRHQVGEKSLVSPDPLLRLQTNRFLFLKGIFTFVKPIRNFLHLLRY